MTFIHLFFFKYNLQILEIEVQNSKLKKYNKNNSFKRTGFFLFFYFFFIWWKSPCDSSPPSIQINRMSRNEKRDLDTRCDIYLHWVEQATEHFFTRTLQYDTGLTYFREIWEIQTFENRSQKINKSERNIYSLLNMSKLSIKQGRFLIEILSLLDFGPNILYII